MTAAAAGALVRRELRLAGPAALAAALAAPLIALVQAGRDVQSDLILWVWPLLGLVLGGGLVARERRLGTWTWIAGLPGSPAGLTAVRAGARLGLLAAAVVAGMAAANLTTRRAGPAGWNWHELAIGLATAVICFGLAGAASALARRETGGFGGGAILFVLALSLFAGYLVLDRYSTLTVLRPLPPLAVAAGAVLAGGLAGALAAVARRDHGSWAERARALVPVAIGLAAGLAAFAAWPRVLLARPLAELDHVDRLAGVPSTGGLMVVGGVLGANWVRGPGVNAHPTSVWRLDQGAWTRTFNVAPFFAYRPSPDGSLVAVHGKEHFWWQDEVAIELRGRDGRLVREARSSGFAPFAGDWSPDGRTYAHWISHRSGNGVVFLPADPARPALEWTPPGSTPEARRVVDTAGWLDDEQFVCLDRPMPQSGQAAVPARLWLVRPGGQADLVWQGTVPQNLPHRWPLPLARGRPSVLLRRIDAGGGGTARLIEIPLDGRPEIDRGPIGAWTDLAVDPDGRRVAWLSDRPAGRWPGAIEILDLATGAALAVGAPLAAGLAFSPDGRFLAARVEQRGIPESGRLLVLDLASALEPHFWPAEPERAGPYASYYPNVDEFAWTGPQALAMALHDNRIVALDVAAGRSETLLALAGADEGGKP